MGLLETDWMRQHVKEIASQREEVVRAFIAKYGFEPDRAIQIEERTLTGFRWSIHRMTDEEYAARQKQAMRSLDANGVSICNGVVDRGNYGG